MSDRRIVSCALVMMAACDAYDASLVSSSRVGAPAAVHDEDIDNAEAAADGGTNDAGAGGDGEAVVAGHHAGAGGAGGAAAAAGHETGGGGGGGGGAAGARSAAGAAADGGSGGRASAGNAAGAGAAGRAGSAGAGSGGSSGAAASGGCDQPDSVVWSSNGHCYFPVSTLGSWNVSRDACNQHDAALVTITSSAEQAFVASLVSATPRWIGLSKFGAPAFTWIDGEALSYTNWEVGAPKVSGEVAAALRDGTAQWFDDAVGSAHAALCERP